MKKVFTLFVGIFIVLSAMSQLQPQLENADAQTNCEMIQNTSFLNREANGNNTPGYRIEYGGGYVTEYLENGKYYVKTKIEFVSACVYTSRVVEVTKPNFHIKVGDTFRTKIVATSSKDGLVKIQIEMKGTTNFIILEKEKK